MRRPTKVRLQHIRPSKIPGTYTNVQDENNEANADGTASLANRHEVHDEHSTPETCLEAVHGEERCGLKGIAQEEDNGENIDQ